MAYDALVLLTSTVRALLRCLLNWLDFVKLGETEPAKRLTLTTEPATESTVGEPSSKCPVRYPQLPPRSISCRKPGPPPVAVNHRRCTSSTSATAGAHFMYGRPMRQPSAIAALQEAVHRREIRSLRGILEGKSPDWILKTLADTPDTLTGTPIIHSAVAGKCPEVMHELLNGLPPESARKLVNVKGPQGQTPLHLACSKKAHEVARLLVHHGADCNATTNLLTTPLHLAAGAGDLELCKLLLDHNADPNCVSKVNSVPLITAVHLRNHLLVSLLLQYGADPKQATTDGMSARQHALKDNDLDLLQLMDTTTASKRRLDVCG